ncbi:Rne/Rng family ribonuclease [Corynebacterium auriscanis]|uniref:Rne/Rng family ribonuclease n=1 Tax=Corynebacterium auriscanis TaxID=99807 RepID=UPI003CF98682
MAKISPELAAQAAQINTEEWGAKVRVHLLAKQLGLRASELLPHIESAGIEGKKVQSSLTKQEAASVVAALSSGDDATSQPETPSAGKSASKKEKANKPQRKKTATRKKTQVAGANAAEAGREEVAGKPEKTEPVSKPETIEKGQAEQLEPAEQAEPLERAGQEKQAKQAKRSKQVEPAEQAEPLERAGQEKQAKQAKRSKQVEPAEQAEPLERAGQEKQAKQAKRSKQVEPAEQAEPQERVGQEEQSEQTTQAEQTGGGQGGASQRRRARRRVVRRVIGRSANQNATANEGATAQTENDASDSTARGGGADDNDAQKAGANQSAAKDDKRAGAQRRKSKNDQAASTPKRVEELHPAERDESDVVDQPVRLKGSTRLASQRQWRRENRERTQTVSRSAFLARRESVERKLVVRDSHRSDHQGLTTQVGVVEDGMLVEHFVTSETQQSMVGNIYLGRVQNVLSSMEAAFIDIGTGRNAVLYAGEMNWHSPHLHSKNRRIDSALKAGDQILVQVIKDPVGHKGARLSNRVSFAGRYLVYFPGGTTAGISRKLPEPERKRLKDILANVIPGDGGAIIRTAAENVPEELIGEDVARLHSIWEKVSKEEAKARDRKGAKPITLYEEPNMLVKVVRDIFNEDFKELVVDGAKSWQVVRDYVSRMAPDLQDRLIKWNPDRHEGEDVFAAMNLDEQLTKALSRKVWLPSGGHLIIDPTEAMTVIDVNTGSFVGSGGNLEETVTQNNLEAAEEIVRQMRLRDLGGMIVVDFIDMVLEENRDLVLRRLTEYLGRDRTRHKVSEVTSLGLVQMTRKRLGTGLLETFSTICTECDGRGVILHADPVEHEEEEAPRRDHGHRKERQQARRQQVMREGTGKPRRDESSRRGDKAHRDDNDAGSSSTEVGSPAELASSAEQTESRSHDKATSTRRVRRRRVVRSVTGSQHDTDARNVDEGLTHRRRAKGNNVADDGQAKTNRRRRANDVAIDDIAASALRNAKAEDPDEPSGADYMPNDAHGDERGSQRIAGINRDTRVNPDTQGNRDKDSEGVSTSRRRRVRRVVRARHVNAANTREQGQAPADRASSSTEHTDVTQSDATQSRESQSRDSRKRRAVRGRHADSQTFEEAKAEFEASPRRKRQTRGNSRSDIAPQPEDFERTGAKDHGQGGRGRSNRTQGGRNQNNRNNRGHDGQGQVNRGTGQQLDSAAPRGGRGSRRVRRVVRKRT